LFSPHLRAETGKAFNTSQMAKVALKDVAKSRWNLAENCCAKNKLLRCTKHLSDSAFCAYTLRREEQ
jgi:hypothetical protein